MLTLETVLAKHPDVATRTVDGHAVAISTEPAARSPELVTFNETGTIIWDLIDGPTVVRCVIDQVAARYAGEAPERLARETLAVLERLVEMRFLIVTP